MGFFGLCSFDGRVHQYRILPDANGFLSVQVKCIFRIYKLKIVEKFCSMSIDGFITGC